MAVDGPEPGRREEGPPQPRSEARGPADGASALERRVEEAYPRLKRAARLQRRRWDGEPTLQTTALVHEAYLRLAGAGGVDAQSDSHFLATAGRTMRHILVDRARRRQAAKRGGDRTRLSLAAVESWLDGDARADDLHDPVLLALERALGRLEAWSPRQARVVECRFFAGMSIPETAEAVQTSPATVKRDWATARSWLYRELRRDLGAGPSQGPG